MKLQDIKDIAQNMGLPARKMTKVELVRAIQRKEGNRDCYETGSVESCGQYNCLWREDCK